MERKNPISPMRISRIIQVSLIILFLTALVTPVSAAPVTQEPQPTPITEETLPPPADPTVTPNDLPDQDVAIPGEMDIEAPTIVGGVVVNPPGKYAWQVALVSSSSTNLFNGQFCGGSLITSQWVLTAAHCTEGETASTIDVVAGIHNLSTGTGYQRRKVSQIIMHSGYNSITTNNDIALLKLTTPMTLGGSLATRVTTIPLVPPSIGSLAGSNTTVSGWGTISDGGSSSAVLREVTVPVITNAVCNDASHYNGQITSGMLCAGFEAGGKDSCSGDSGGPLIVNYGGYKLAGIVSWGEGCALAHKPGVYTRLSNYLPWVAHNISSQYIIRVQWNATPLDLDAHLWLPTANRYHVYYGTRGSLTAAPYAQLDKNDQDGTGPENITIIRPYNGIYQYAIYNRSGSPYLKASSGAIVRIYNGSILIREFYVSQASGLATGRWWKVFALNPYTGAITAYNQLSNTSPAPYAASLPPK